jgi:hypothetical protein
MKDNIAAATAAFGNMLTAIVAILIAIQGGKQDEKAAHKPAGKPAGKPADTNDNDDDDLLGGDGEDTKTEEPTVTLADLKKVGQEVIKNGKADKFKAVLKKFGAENLGSLEEGQYADVKAALDKLNK